MDFKPSSCGGGALDSPDRAAFDHSSIGSTHCLAQCGCKGCRASSVSGHPVMGGNGRRKKSKNLGFRVQAFVFRV